MPSDMPMTEESAVSETEGPERRCIVSGESGPKEGLLRFVASPDGVVVPDLLERLPGRGMYVTSTADALAVAVKKNLFSRAARQPLTVREDLVAEVDRLLAKRVVELVSLARKAGEAVAGFEKVKEQLDKGQAKVLLQASDGSVRGKSKLWTPTGGRWFGCLTSNELGLAFGRESVIHAALAAGGLARRVVDDAARLSGLRKEIGASGAGKD